MKLNSSDLKIIRCLEKSARKPVKDIAKELGLSRPTVAKRIRTLVENGLVSFNVGINLSKLNYRFAIVGIKIRGRDKLMQAAERMKKCPRVSMIIQPSEEINLILLMHGETQKALECTIESIRLLKDSELVFVYYSDPPLYPTTIQIKTYYNEEKLDLPPCNIANCHECEVFRQKCPGCPAIKDYQSLC